MRVRVSLKRLIVLHAGTRSEGLIDGCDLLFLAKSKDDDYHQEMNCVVILYFLMYYWDGRSNFPWI
jgi:hypothetical protein